MTHTLVQNSRLNFGELPENPDVELICSDGRILVHRVLLAATSQWMKNIFKVSLTDDPIQTVMLQDVQTYQIIPTIDFLYGRSDKLTRDEMNKDLLFDVFNSSFPNCSVNIIVKTENEERKINFDTRPSVETCLEASFDDMLQVEIKEEKDEMYEDNKDVLYDLMMEEQNWSDDNQNFDAVKPPTKRKKKKIIKGNAEGKSEDFYQEKEKLICEKCNKEFAHKSSLTKHMKFIHSSGVKSKCDLCSYETANSHDLKIHRQRMHEGVEWPCDQCEYRSRSKSHLKHHIKTKHEGFRLQCDQCDNQYTDHSSLRSHRQKEHENIKYPCKECSYIGSNKQNLYTHQKRCHLEKQLMCDECDFATATNPVLKEHKAIHHQGFRFKCDICDYTTKARSSLQYHRKVKHSDSKIPCDVCGFMAWNDSHLKSHKNNCFPK